MERDEVLTAEPAADTGVVASRGVELRWGASFGIAIGSGSHASIPGLM